MEGVDQRIQWGALKVEGEVVVSKGGSDKRICQERQQISGAKRASVSTSVHRMHKTPVVDVLVATRERH